MSKKEALILKLISALTNPTPRPQERKQTDDLPQIYPWLNTMFPDEPKCVTRILMVADGILTFGRDVGAHPFALNKMIADAFNQEALTCEQFDIKTAHRFEEGKSWKADTYDFKFDAPPANPQVPQFNRENYDQVWLFGMSDDKPISHSEVEAIAEFMRQGGGVFATGDHEEAGKAMCGELPRVRSMRLWENPSAVTSERVDTRRIGAASPFTSSDEEDEFPQIIHPKLYIEGKHKGMLPHFLFEMESGKRIRILPDHMHEGMCPELRQKELTSPFLLHAPSTDQEFPVSEKTGRQVMPEVVALSTSPAWGFPFEAEQEGVMQRCFGAVSTYDGHEVGQGRVVVDASFHHFTNAHLDRLRTEDYESLRRYYRNIATWLTPPPVRRRRYLRLLVTLRYIYPLIEEIPSRKSLVGKDLPSIGARTRKVISDRLSPSEAIECALSLLGWPDTNSQMGILINPWLPYDLRAEKTSGLLDPEEVTNFVLGAAMWAVLFNLPPDAFEASKALRDKEMLEGFELAASRNVNTVMNSLSPFVSQLSDTVGALCSKFKI